MLVLYSGSGGGAGGGVRDVTGRMVPRLAPAGGIVGRLLDLADMVRRLPPPGRHDPERFWRDKSDLAGRLAELAGEAAAERPGRA